MSRSGLRTAIQANFAAFQKNRNTSTLRQPRPGRAANWMAKRGQAEVGGRRDEGDGDRPLEAARGAEPVDGSVGGHVEAEVAADRGAEVPEQR